MSVHSEASGVSSAHHSPGQPSPSQKGTVMYQSGVFGADRAARAIRELQQRQSQILREAGQSTAPGIGPFAVLMGLGTMLATAGLFGTSLAQLLQGPQAQPGSLEIEVTNLSSWPVVLYDTALDGKVESAKSIDPLGTGDGDTFLLYRPDPFQSGDGVVLRFLVGGQAPGIGVSGIETQLLYHLSSQDSWNVQAIVDGQSSIVQSATSLFAANFEPTSSLDPNFGFYTSPITTKNGRIGLTFFDGVKFNENSTGDTPGDLRKESNA